MKKLFVIAFLFLSVSGFSQSRYNRGPSLKEFGVGLGAFWPSMSYYTEQFNYDFNQGLSSQFTGTIALNTIVGVRLGVGYNRIKGTQVVTSEWNEYQTLGIMPFNAELLINYGVGSTSRKFSSGFSPNFYIGGGAGYSLLFIKYSTDTGTAQNNTGATLTYHGLAGVQIPVGPISVGLEGQYVFGEYSQAFILGNGTESLETVSIKGPKAFVTVSYPLYSVSRRSGSSYGRRRTYHSKPYHRGGLFSRLFRSKRAKRR